jgi:hypothetical protein
MFNATALVVSSPVLVASNRSHFREAARRLPTRSLARMSH